MFVVETLAGGSEQTAVLIRLGAKVTYLVASGEYWRLFTSMFLHIGFAHLLFNGYALVAIGTELERLLGPVRFLVIYLLSGLYGALASYAFSVNLSAGASGAIFGLIGALAAFFFLHRARLGNWGRMRLANIAFLIAINLFFGFTYPGIDNLAHLGGLLGGFGLGWALAPRYEVEPVGLQVIDRNRLSRYWPALILAVTILAAGTALATRIQLDNPLTHLLRGEDAIEREAWDEAVLELEEAIAQDPSLADASIYFYLGLARNYLDQPQLAADAYESALKFEGDHAPIYWNLAQTYVELGRYADALDRLEAYLQLKPEEAEGVQSYLDELRRRQ
jgi:rhomboid protease GluP